MPIPNIVSFGTLSKDVATGAVGTTITISNTGTGFFGTMLVDVGGIACTDITLVDHQHVTCKSPAASGTVNITNPDGETGTVGTWAHIPTAPSITSVSPDTASAAGGETIEINGAFEDFAGSTVDYGGTAATVTAAAADKITITAPAHSEGEIIITVTDSYTQSDTASFTVAAPATTGSGIFFFFEEEACV